MDDGTCSIEGCANRAEKRTWCAMHYRRWQRHGSPLGGGVPRFRDPEVTFRARLQEDGECLTWTGALNDQGYGRLRVDGILVRAHRYAWERSRGPIPVGMYVDHVCHNRACVNVEHLRLADHGQNESNRGGATVRNRLGVRNVHKDGNLYYVTVTKGGRVAYKASFATLSEAAAAASDARASIFGAFSGRP